MHFEWDEHKNRRNLLKHEVRFETAFPHVPPKRMKGTHMRKLTKEQKRDIAAIATKKDEDIDFSDMPAVVDWSRAEIGKFYRPPKRPVTIRLDVDVLNWLKTFGRGYQTRANLLLRHAMMSSRANGAQRISKYRSR